MQRHLMRDNSEAEQCFRVPIYGLMALKEMHSQINAVFSASVTQQGPGSSASLMWQARKLTNPYVCRGSGITWITDLVINDRLSDSCFSLQEYSVSQHEPYVWSLYTAAATLTFHIPSQQLFGLRLHHHVEKILWISCQGQARDLPHYAFKRTNFQSDCSRDPRGYTLVLGLN